MHTQKRKVCVSHFIAASALLLWSGTRPARSPRCVCCTKRVHWAPCKPGALLSSSHGLCYLILITTSGKDNHCSHSIRGNWGIERLSNLLKTRRDWKGRVWPDCRQSVSPLCYAAGAWDRRRPWKEKCFVNHKGLFHRKQVPTFPPGAEQSRVMCSYVRPWACAFFQCVKKDTGTTPRLWKNHCT